MKGLFNHIKERNVNDLDFVGFVDYLERNGADQDRVQELVNICQQAISDLKNLKWKPGERRLSERINRMRRDLENLLSLEDDPGLIGYSGEFWQAALRERDRTIAFQKFLKSKLERAREGGLNVSLPREELIINLTVINLEDYLIRFLKGENLSSLHRLIAEAFNSNGIPKKGEDQGPWKAEWTSKEVARRCSYMTKEFRNAESA